MFSFRPSNPRAWIICCSADSSERPDGVNWEKAHNQVVGHQGDKISVSIVGQSQIFATTSWTKLHRYGHVSVIEIPDELLARVREANKVRCLNDPMRPKFSKNMKYVCTSKTHVFTRRSWRKMVLAHCAMNMRCPSGGRRETLSHLGVCRANRMRLSAEPNWRNA